MLHKETVSDHTLGLIKELQEKYYLKDFTLVGGTALSLHNGNRVSVDIDLFSIKPFNVDSMLEELEKDFQFELDFSEKNTLKGSIRGVKVDLITHAYNYIEEPQIIDGINIASEKDICAMKLRAISADGTRVKDFIDVYFLLDKYTIKEMLGFFEQKYSLQSSFHALKSLSYFDDINLEDWPVIIKEKSLKWEEVKDKIDNAVNEFIKSIEKEIKNINNNNQLDMQM